MLEHILLTLALVDIALLLGGCVYESVVVAPNFERDVPASIEQARQFFQKRHGGHFFRVLAPLGQLLLVATVIVCWQISHMRLHAVVALGVLVIADIITFKFHYPRIAIMFRAPMPRDTEKLRTAAREWSAGNVVRAALLLFAFLVVLHAVVASAGYAHI